MDTNDASGIHIKPSHAGRLHKALGIPADKPIPRSRLEAAAHSKDPAVRKMANFALNAKKWHHDGEPADGIGLLPGDEDGPPVVQHYDGMMRPNPKR